MKDSLKKYLITSLVLILALSPIMLRQNVVAQDEPSVFVNPAENIFYTDTTSVGTEFDLTIEAAGWVDPGVYSFELKLYFDSSMLAPVVDKIGIDPDFWITAFVAASGLDTGDVPYVDPDTGDTFLWFSATLLGAGGNIGDGILAKAGFQIIAEPATGQTLSSSLDLEDVIMVNPATTPPSAYSADYFTVQDGIYQYISPPPPMPTLKASSHSWDMDEAEAAGGLFDITISIEDLEEGWHLVGIQFWLEFDTTLLSTREEWITEGDFLSEYGGTFSVNYTEGDHVIYGVLQLPPWPGPNGWASGSGTVATIQFEAIFIPQSASAGCNLTLFNVVLVDEMGNEIPYNLEHGHYEITLRPTPLLKASSHTWDAATAEAAGGLFDITISINDLLPEWRLVGIQFWLEFDTTLLSTREEWITEGDFLSEYGGTFSINYTEGDSVIYGLLQLPPWQEPWPSGSGTVATIQFEAIFIPPPAASCDLTLFNVILLDNNTIEIPYRLESGAYSITVAPPPWLSVSPKTVELEDLGDTFDLNIAVNELDAGFRMVGVEFKVYYDTDYLETREEWITEGTDNIMREVADRIGEGLFFQAYVQEDYGLIGIIILPLPDGTWPYYPEGSGVLAAIKFQAIDQLDDEDIVTLVTLDEIMLVDSDAKEILYDETKTTMEGTCVCTILKSFIYTTPEHPAYPYSIDLHTQYVDPYGGQGYRVPSDAFAPQGQVDLEAEVTYRGDPVANKPVAYHIEGPNGYEFAGVEFSDANGIAVLEFSVPASTTYFGIWEVSSSVDIAGVVVTDDLMFRVGWLIQAETISIDGVEVEDVLTLAKGKQYELSATLKIATMQNPADCVQLQGMDASVLLSYSGFDELNQPIIAANWMELLIEDKEVVSVQDTTDFIRSDMPDDWFGFYDTDGEYGRLFQTGEKSIIIPCSAYSGLGVIYANVFTGYPWEGGVPYSDPTVGMAQVWIQRAEEPPPVIPTIPIIRIGSHTSSFGDVPSEFAIEVTIEDLDASLHAIAIQFELEFDTDLLDVSYPDGVIEGPFVKFFGDTFFVWEKNENILAGVIQLQPWPGSEGWMSTATFGSPGTVCTIVFNEIHADPCASSALTLISAETYLVDPDGNTIDVIVEHGQYEVIP